MKIKTILISALLITLFTAAQLRLVIEGTITENNQQGDWEGINISRSVPTLLTFRNNYISSVNASGYMLHAGDERRGNENNNLDGQVITGNRFIWKGKSRNSNTHALFTGYNINASIMYNYLENIPSGIQMKSDGMENTGGAVAYNIINNPGQAAVPVKGMRNVRIFNNTFYSKQVFYRNDTTGVWRGLIDIYSNTDEGQDASASNSSGTKIKNNIFYTVNKIYNIAIYDSACLPGFESDYNIFWCEAGMPVFNYLGRYLSFDQWRALGYDTHSRLMDPGFEDYENFVPAKPLSYGTGLGEEFLSGLSEDAVWIPGREPSKKRQNTEWQIGARIF